MDKLKVYSMPTWGKCDVLKSRLDEEKYEYEEIKDPGEVRKVAMANGLFSVPFCIFPGETEVLTFSQTLARINKE